MKSILSTELEILMKNLKLLNAPVLELLNPPAEQIHISNLFNEYFPGTPIHEDIFDIFLWHNGTATDYQSPATKFYIIAGFLFNSINEMESTLYTLDFIYEFKQKGFIPLFSNGHGEHLAINLKDYSNNPGSSKVFHLSTTEIFPELYTSIYDSFYQMFITVNECFKQGVYFIDGKGLMDFDFKRYYKISGEMNPNSEYWKD